MPLFPTSLASIKQRIFSIDPIGYAASRNFANGSVTRLGLYISRGVISTRHVYDHIRSLEIPWQKAEKLVQELAWRDYWQQVWMAKGDAINTDLKTEQHPIANYQMPTAIKRAATGIEVMDDAITALYETGYMHNHMRMYVASICCNIAQCHWHQPAKWMYAHLLDGDLASNHLSWQWVAGSNANKKYYANQNNINTYFPSRQQHTFLDVPYEAFASMPIPEVLKNVVPFQLDTDLSDFTGAVPDGQQKTLIYNYNNLDPEWHKGEKVQRILLLEPQLFKSYPVSTKCIDFALELSKNIEGIKVFVGSFGELVQLLPAENIIFKEHPLNRHYSGKEEPRDWMTSISGYFPSFFAFWKRCKKELKW